MNLAVPTPAPSPAAPVVLAGSPLHHILGTTSPETGQQLRNLFTLLQVSISYPLGVCFIEMLDLPLTSHNILFL
jgi:hypothetical protein